MTSFDTNPATQANNTHLMIVQAQYAPDLISGRKSVESRLGKDRRTPFGRVHSGDLVYMKSTGGPVFAAARIKRADEFENLAGDDVARLRDMYEDRVLGGDAYWESKSDATVATLIWLTDVRPIADASCVPPELLKPSRNAWRTHSAIKPTGAKRAA